MTPHFFPKFNFLNLTCLLREMDIRATICNQNFIKLNIEETNSVFSWRECMWIIIKEQQSPDESTSHAHTARACAIGLVTYNSLTISLSQMLQRLLKCSNNSVLFRFQKHAREVKYRFAGEEQNIRKKASFGLKSSLLKILKYL